MAGQLRPNIPLPLMANGTLERWKKNVPKIFLNGPALYPPPTLNGPAIKGRHLKQ